MARIDDDYKKRLEVAFNHNERVAMASELTCPDWLLQQFCEKDIEIDVVEAAILNPLCKEYIVKAAFKRFPDLDCEAIKIKRERRKWAYKKMLEIKGQEEEAKKQISGDRDQILLNHILMKDEHNNRFAHDRSHLGNIKNDNGIVFRNPDIDWKDTDKFRVAMVMAPSWGVIFPPYNIAKLTGLLRGNGYSVKVYDANIESYHYLLENDGQDYWRSERWFLWMYRKNFVEYLLPGLTPVLDKIIKDIIESKPKVVGFSLYNTNFHAAMYIARELRVMCPDLCLVAGGPETITAPHRFESNDPYEAKDCFNYIFVGEAEQNLLNILEDLPEKLPMNEIVGSTKSKLNLDIFSYPDYTDYDIPSYLNNGVSIETSRGCVAQCSFCDETYFWGFRSLTPERVVEEMKHQIELHDVKRFWFVDSLVNGHVKNFKKLVDLIIENKLNIHWNSYSRCDGRMDFEFFRQIKKSGCTALSFGVESGSQKILHDMRKKIEIWEVEQNLKDGTRVGLFNHINWLVGFATEENIDNFHSLQLLYNIRKWASAISPGYTAGLSIHSHSVTNPEAYNIIRLEDGKPNFGAFLDAWATEGYKNTILHRFVRLKMCHIWLDIIKTHCDSTLHNAMQPQSFENFYKFSFKKYLDVDYLEQDFNVNLNQFDEGTYENSIANEYVAFVYLLSRYFVGVKYEFFCDFDKDMAFFGDHLVRNYYCHVTFKTDKSNNYKLVIDHELKGHFKNTVVRTGNTSDWQTKEAIVRETVHEQYRKKK